jgi:hypothetical protein
MKEEITLSNKILTEKLFLVIPKNLSLNLRESDEDNKTDKLFFMAISKKNKNSKKRKWILTFHKKLLILI